MKLILLITEVDWWPHQCCTYRRKNCVNKILTCFFHNLFMGLQNERWLQVSKTSIQTFFDTSFPLVQNQLKTNDFKRNWIEIYKEAFKSFEWIFKPIYSNACSMSNGMLCLFRKVQLKCFVWFPLQFLHSENTILQ